jgi:hypothetical protein
VSPAAGFPARRKKNGKTRQGRIGQGERLMKKIILNMAVVVILLVPAAVVLAEECPEIDANLRFELYKNFPQAEIAFVDRFLPEEQAKLTGMKGDDCLHAVAAAPYLYVILLKDKGSESYRIVQAGTSMLQKAEIWSVREIDVFTNDVPVLSMAKGGFYADVATGDRMTVTRNSVAFTIVLLRSGNQFVYKSKGDDQGFARCRIR